MINTQKLDDILNKMIEEERQILWAKGMDYSEDDDRTLNFKEIATMTRKFNKYEVWTVYFLKHVQSIIKFCMTGKTESENIENRILDARNYLVLLRAMIEEDKPNDNVKQIGIDDVVDLYNPPASP